MFIISQIFLELDHKLNIEIPPKNTFNEDINSTTTQPPENLSDGDEEAKFYESIKLKIEWIKTESCKLKRFLPTSKKIEPLSPFLKSKAKMAQIHPFRNLIFNPNCPKDSLRKHLEMVHKSVEYAVNRLKKSKEAKPQSGIVFLVEKLGTNL